MSVWSREQMLQCNTEACPQWGKLLELQKDKPRYTFKCNGCQASIRLIENSISFRE
ncbi:hypothetical protein LCGC14_0566890 [marine sediment metagenome]|uniref:Uncharacterized protein n=1 Tax=marine sediment metagenome TaxID=412755 RepID=A0A0F9S3Y1_9ZZZZ